MTKGIRYSFNRVLIYAGIVVAATGAAMLVSSSPASPPQNVPATKQALSGLSGAANRPAGVAGSPANQLVANYGKLPLGFEPNEGQTDGRVKFLSRGHGYTLFLTGDEAVLALRKPGAMGPEPNEPMKQARLDTVEAFSPFLRHDEVMFKPDSAAPRTARAFNSEATTTAVVGLQLVGANSQVKVTGLEELPGKSNYFLGNDPKKWRTNVPNYAKVKYASVYPGVDLVYYGNQGGQLEYDFVVAPGADPSAIKLDVGADGVRPAKGEHRSPLHIAADGDLIVNADGGEIRFHKPVVYQPAINNGQLTTDNGQRTPVDGHYVLQASNQVGFKVPSYDHTRPLVIDPVLSYSTYLGGIGSDYGSGIAVDSLGDTYVTGYTNSTDFPTATPLQASNRGGDGDAFVVKMNAAGSALVYSTYLGGSYYDQGSGIAVDSSGNAYVTGETYSADFPTVNPFQATFHGGNQDAFVAKVAPDGSALIYSTYLGGNGGDFGFGIAADSTGNAYVVGTTDSTDFPTVNPLQASSNGRGDVFVAKLNSAGSALAYSTYLGGSGDDWGQGIAIDSFGSSYVTGVTNSTDFPTVNPLQASAQGGGADAFVAKLNSAGSTVVYSTYLGGTSYDVGQGIAVDSSGNAYVTGYTGSPDFPTVNPLQASFRGGFDAFVAKLNAAGSALVYSTYLGGNGDDRGSGIAVDSSGNAYVTGSTSSTDFPTANPLQAPNHGSYDAFVSGLNAAGSALVYSTYLGGSDIDRGYGIALDSSGNAYVNGYTGSTDFPTMNPLQANIHGGGDAFVAKISPGVGVPSVILLPSSLTFGPQLVGTTSAPQTVTLTNTGEATLSVSSMVASGDLVQTNNCGSSVAAGGNCTISVNFTPTSIGTRTGAITITDNASNSPQTVALSGLGVLPVVLNPTSLIFGNQAENTTSPPQVVNLINTQSTALAISVTTSGDFAQTNTCGSSVPGRGRCTISVTFTPSVLGVDVGTLTVTDGASNSPQTAALSGRGVLQAELSSPSLWFAAQKVGSPSAATNVILTNNLSTTLTISSITFTGAGPGDFAQTNTCGGSLAAKSRCSISVTFTPAATGIRRATLNINDSANNSPQTVALTGTGN